MPRSTHALSCWFDAFRTEACGSIRDGASAEAVAARFGSRVTASMDGLLQDEAMDRNAECSPNRFHANRVIPDWRPKKRSVVCEKRSVTTADAASQVALVSAQTGTAILQGPMHAYHPSRLAFPQT